MTPLNVLSRSKGHRNLAGCLLYYDLNEPLLDHSSLTRIRTRYGVEVFRWFFEAIVEQCQQAGLVWGRELYIDGTKVQANASKDSLKPRFAVEAHLAHLFTTVGEEAAEGTDQDPARRSLHTVVRFSHRRRKPPYSFPSRSPRNTRRNSVNRIPSAMTGSSN